jgi:hypothetical protein
VRAALYARDGAEAAEARRSSGRGRTQHAALNNVAVVIQEVAVLSNIGNLQVVNVEDVLNNTDILRNARFLNNITILRDFLNDSVNNNNILNDFLNNNNIAISDVVAVDVLSGGDITVFVQEQ